MRYLAILSAKMKTSDFDYGLPPELIAQQPLEPRHSSRLLALKRGNGSIEHRRFTDLTAYLKEGDVLVFNESRVIPARLEGKRVDSGAKIEILLLNRLEPGLWQALAKPARRAIEGAEVDFGGLTARVVATPDSEGVIRLRFEDERRLETLGTVPLPPYIKAPLADPERYQTVYARSPGSAAAPTAGLHFTGELFEEIDGLGVQRLFVNLHIGLDTFRPVREDDPLKHRIHKEYGFIDQETADAISRAKEEGRRIIGVGTSAVRLLEGVAEINDGLVRPYEGWIGLFILPGHKFRVVDTMLTNFHLPRSTLLMLVSAFAGEDIIRKAYDEAIAERYRFYSFGDAMLIL